VELNNAVIGATCEPDRTSKDTTALPCLAWKHLSQYNVLMDRLFELVHLWIEKLLQDADSC
jgi:hypothetical protein